METILFTFFIYKFFEFLSYLWGMETGIVYHEPCLLWFWFLSYLWGMETIWFLLKRRNPCSCSYPTYEEWKHSKVRSNLDISVIVLILPMRNGNLEKLNIHQHYFHVLILPMRNGNSHLSAYWHWQTSRSYPTYEEWKPWFGKCSRSGGFCVLILPMRNGNFSNFPRSSTSKTLFLSYLWGMETLINIANVRKMW